MTEYECQSNQQFARDMRRRLLVWRARHGEHVKRFERFERAVRRRFGHDSLPTEDLPLPVRIAVIEHALDQRLQ